MSDTESNEPYWPVENPREATPPVTWTRDEDGNLNASQGDYDGK